MNAKYVYSSLRCFIIQVAMLLLYCAQEQSEDQNPWVHLPPTSSMPVPCPKDVPQATPWQWPIGCPPGLGWWICMLMETPHAAAEICTSRVHYCCNFGALLSTSMWATPGEKTLQRQWPDPLCDPAGGCCFCCHLEEAAELWSFLSIGKQQLHQDNFDQGNCVLLSVFCWSSEGNGSFHSDGSW